MNDLGKLVAVCCLVLGASNTAGQEPATELYEQQIKPLFKQRCFACHGALKQESGLRLDTVEAMQDHDILESGDLLDRLTSEDDAERMPPEGEPLKGEELAVIKKWMAAGAPAPDGEVGEADPAQHWAFQKSNARPYPSWVSPTRSMPFWPRHKKRINSSCRRLRREAC